MKNLINTLRNEIGTPEFLFLLGMLLLYAGSSAQFGHPVAQILCGFALVIVSLLMVFKTK